MVLSFFPLLFVFFAVSRRSENTVGQVDSLIDAARQSLSLQDTDAAFDYLAQAHAKNANARGLQRCFQDVFRARIELHGSSLDRMGLGSLLLDSGNYQEAAREFQLAMETVDPPLDHASRDRAASSLFKARAAICDWKTIGQDSDALRESVRSSLALNRVPSVHPYEALMWPCLSLQDAGQIAAQYASRAMLNIDSVKEATGVHLSLPVPTIKVHSRRPMGVDPSTGSRSRKLRVGYISPDFTGVHPLAFLMQDVFRFHDTQEFQVFIYSLMEYDESLEVEKIKEAATEWKVLMDSSMESAEIIKADKLDILVDLAGYVGPSVGAEIMAHRPAPVQISYMGFPASNGAPYIDYLVCDETVVSPLQRPCYSENLLFMPHCYFVNSHRYLPGDKEEEAGLLRSSYGLPENSFVFCCHNRAEKIDVVTFRSWLRVLRAVPDSVLWLLSGGDQMEGNLKRIASQEFGLKVDRLIFCDTAPRKEYLRRLKLADLFLDTPAYNAHTTGCDCLHAGVPMVSLLRGDEAVPVGQVATDKLASRVGASLLRALELEDLIAPDMETYEGIMKRCATDRDWFEALQEKLKANRMKCPLFDTERWVRNLETGLKEIVENKEAIGKDIYVIDK